ncbi:MAG TPA: hypothetical protein VGQ76_00795 [Thermoanaerobaculia bacterium]|nr:hypothetical protein [Thermoanaerobaculia bacterium]
MRLFVSLLLVLSAVAVFADDPPPGTVVQRQWLRPCLDSGSVTYDQYEYRCTSAESSVQVYNIYTRAEYLKDAVYRVDRSPLSNSNFYAYAVKQYTEVADTKRLDSAALVIKRDISTKTPGWAYKKKD